MPECGTLFADDLVGGYLIERFLCAGPVFEIYSAFHPQLEVRRLFYVLRPALYHGDPSVRDAFLAEIQRIVQIRHPNMIPVSDVGWEENRDLLYYVTDQLSAPTLEDRLKDGAQFSEKDALSTVSVLTGVLQLLEKNGLRHLRISPGNLFLHESRGPILVEPGLCLKGIPAEKTMFSAPELTRDAATADVRADIYGLGALWFMMLTGKAPEQPSADPRLHVPPIGKDAAVLIKRMLDAKPDNRPASPDALMAELARLPGGMAFDNPELQEMTTQEIDQTVSDRTRILAEKLQVRHQREVRLWKYAVIALGALAVLLLGRDIWLSVRLLMQSSRRTAQQEAVSKAQAVLEGHERQMAGLRQDIQLERTEIERIRNEIESLKKIIPSGGGK